MEVKCRVVFVFVVVVASIARESLAVQHLVGGSQGWDQSTDFSSWASGKKFKVGDELVFKYSPSLHSVVEIGSETAYKNCDVGTTLDSKNSGKDVIKLNKVGTRYFACGTLGHCQSMKLKITTIAADATQSSPTSSSSEYSSSAPTLSFTASIADRWNRATMIKEKHDLCLMEFSLHEAIITLYCVRRRCYLLRLN